MMRWCLAAVACALLVWPAGVRAQGAPKTAVKDMTDTTAFAADLYGRLAAGEKGNLFFSPESIETALGMTYAGAKGTTAEQMAKTLHYTGSGEEVSAAFGKLIQTLNHPPEVSGVDEKGQPVKKPAYQLVVANALWGQQGFPYLPAFTELVRKDYGAGLNAVDFRQPEAARKTINDWVAAQTKDKIKDLLGPRTVTPDTRLVLTNAVYFKSNWDETFKKAATKDGTFTVAPGQTVEVPLMHQRHSFGYLENADVQVLEMPYKVNALSMLVVLPKQADGLATLEKGLTGEKLQGWMKGLQGESVEVTLPKFTFASQFQLGDALQAMGMPAAFDSKKADFSGMTSAERFWIGAVIHKAFVAVDEEGTEAAAATAVMMFGAAAVRPAAPKVFQADHPFIFMIRHNATGEVLFLGRVVNPKGT